MSKKAKKTIRMILSVLLAVILSVQVSAAVFAVMDENAVEPRLTTSKTLPIDFIHQTETLWCWAACGASVVNWMTDQTVTEAEFCYTCTGSVSNQQIELVALKNKLVIYYDITSVYEEYDSSISDNRVATQILSLAEIKSYIDAGKPIIANIGTGADQIGHCVVICGYVCNDATGDGTVIYMDPWEFSLVEKRYDDFCYQVNVQTWYGALYELNWMG